MADMICHKVYELLSILNTFIRPNQLRKMQPYVPGSWLERCTGIAGSISARDQ